MYCQTSTYSKKYLAVNKILPSQYILQSRGVFKKILKKQYFTERDNMRWCTPLKFMTPRAETPEKK
jgi:hypothetical protein